MLVRHDDTSIYFGCDRAARYFRKVIVIERCKV